MNLARMFWHLWIGERAVHRALPESAFDRIQQAVHSAETQTAGQIRVVVEDSLPLTVLLGGTSTRERALEVFSRLRVWDTQHNSGVLVYLLFADRAVEIIADRGVHERVGNGAWENICHAMEAAFRADRFESGLVDGVSAIGRILSEHFPTTGQQSNELPDRPRLI